MKKAEFIKELRASLTRIPISEREEAVYFYDEIISDKIEAGMTEEEAVESLGRITLLSDFITAENVENNMKKSKAKSPIKSFFTVLALCSSPVLAIVGGALLIVFIALVISFAVVGVSLFVSSVGALIMGVVTAVYNAGQYGAAGIIMSLFAFLFAAALLCFLGIIFVNGTKIVIKSLVGLFARLVKRSKRSA